MHYSVKNLKGYAIGARDGDIGKVDDFYFDDGTGRAQPIAKLIGKEPTGCPISIGPYTVVMFSQDA